MPGRPTEISAKVTLTAGKTIKLYRIGLIFILVGKDTGRALSVQRKPTFCFKLIIAVHTCPHKIFSELIQPQGKRIRKCVCPNSMSFFLAFTYQM